MYEFASADGEMKVVYPYAQKKEILELLEEHITENIVKVDLLICPPSRSR